MYLTQARVQDLLAYKVVLSVNPRNRQLYVGTSYPIRNHIEHRLKREPLKNLSVEPALLANNGRTSLDKLVDMFTRPLQLTEKYYQ